MERSKPLLKVGLTGGIACGKTGVRREFERLGAATVDADDLAHQAIEPSQPAYRGIVSNFGREILDEEGRIDRKKLGAIIFSQPEQRALLNEIVHPQVYILVDRWYSQVSCREPAPAFAIIDAALIVETGSYKRYDCIVVAHCPPEEQMQRLLRRDGLSEETARQRLESQMPIEEKMRYADYLIDTSGPVESTKAQVAGVFQRIRAERIQEGADQP